MNLHFVEAAMRYAVKTVRRREIRVRIYILRDILLERG